MAYNPNLYSPYGLQQPINGLIKVAGYESAVAYPLPPNSTIALFDANEDVMYHKTTDATGFATVDVYDLSLRKKQAQQEQMPVSREEFDRLAKMVENAIQRPKESKELDDGEQFISNGRNKQQHT